VEHLFGANAVFREPPPAEFGCTVRIRVFALALAYMEAERISLLKLVMVLSKTTMADEQCPQFITMRRALPSPVCSHFCNQENVVHS
jgi:hypothetical protein